MREIRVTLLSPGPCTREKHKKGSHKVTNDTNRDGTAVTTKEAIQAQRAAGIVERAAGAQKRQRRQIGWVVLWGREAPAAAGLVGGPWFASRVIVALKKIR